MSNSYYLSESLTCCIASFLLQHVLKMSSSSTNASSRCWRDYYQQHAQCMTQSGSLAVDAPMPFRFIDVQSWKNYN